ncbi:hypothetical protein NIES4102_27600 [Chondrocystis sp. NIES-4102]|nr:hypothetical protein NIES4102_27600 [Chondrocystis sp. NIES-4102]
MTLKYPDNNVERSIELSVETATNEDTQAISLILAKSFYNFPEFAHWIYPFLQFTINEDLRYRLRSHSPLYFCLVAKLDQGNYQTTTQQTSHSLLRCKTTERVRTIGQNPYNSNLIVVGTVEIALRSPSVWSSHLQYPYISNLAVRKEYRRLGIGSKLLHKCEEIALNWGFKETRLHVLDNNNSAKQLYKNNGYQVSSTETNWSNLWFDYSPRLLLKKQISTN